MPEEVVSSTSQQPAPWFSGREVSVLVYKVNRRPLPQGNLLAEQPAGFFDHLIECLLLRHEVVTKGRGRERHWMIGNRNIPDSLRYVVARLGYRAPEMAAKDAYDEDAGEWTSDLIETERVAIAPFVIVADSRLLCIAKHPSFAEGTLPVVFEAILNDGEAARPYPTTSWSVEPLLDETDFAKWLERTAILDRVSFDVRLPNPDAAESFAQLTSHMDAMEAGQMRHALAPRDVERGLRKDFESEPITQGLMEMARRSFARLKARGRSSSGSQREYSQTSRVRRGRLELPEDYTLAETAIAQFGLDQGSQQSDG